MITKLKQIKIDAHQFDELLNTSELIRNNKYDQPKVGLFKEKEEVIKFFWLDHKKFFRRKFIRFHDNLFIMLKKWLPTLDGTACKINNLWLLTANLML